MRYVNVVTALMATGIVFMNSGCEVTEDTPESLYPAKPTISVTTLDAINGGSQLVYHIKVHNEHSQTYIKVSPWNDTTYYFNFNKPYSDAVRLSCNSTVNGSYIDCNKVDEIVCDRTLIGGSYSEYRCDLKIAGVIYPQFKDPMRVATSSNQPSHEDVLVTVGTKYWYEANGAEKSQYVFATDTAKMFNVFSGNVGP